MKNISLKFHSLTLFFLLTSLLCGYIKYSLIILFIILFHELGHALITIVLGYKIQSIVIYPFGGITKIDKPLNDSILNDLLISIFGILFQMLIFILCKINVITSLTVYQINLSIMLFNMLPIIPLDGSKFVLEICNYFMPFQKALRLSIIISLVGIIIFFLFNIYYDLNNYLLLGLFILKTYETFKCKDLYFHKFVVERVLYNLKFNKVDNNKKISQYKKDTRYYYIKEGKVISDKEYLKCSK